jgi:UDP-2,3-diacylglucosamine hydrolase
MNAAVISDLHLFAQRSNAEHHMEAVHELASETEALVLNGDLFDFRWTTLASIEDTEKAAIDWLHDVVARHPHCQFYYILGNHDCLKAFVTKLDHMCHDTPNIEWNPTHYRFGNTLFMHGDLALSKNNGGPFNRTLVEEERRMAQTLHHGYRAVVGMRLHKVISGYHVPKNCARRILRSFDQDNEGIASGVDEIFIGHTHRPFSNYHYQGKVFHNTGSAIRGQKFNMIPTTLPLSGSAPVA